MPRQASDQQQDNSVSLPLLLYQRMCLTPDGDFFTCIREGNASVVCCYRKPPPRHLTCPQCQCSSAIIYIVLVV